MDPVLHGGELAHPQDEEGSKRIWNRGVDRARTVSGGRRTVRYSSKREKARFFKAPTPWGKVVSRSAEPRASW